MSSGQAEMRTTSCPKRSRLDMKVKTIPFFPWGLTENLHADTTFLPGLDQGSIKLLDGQTWSVIDK